MAADQPSQTPTLRCPACNASNNQTTTCRRCNADLTLLQQLAQSCQTTRQVCLNHLRSAEPAQALHHARQLHRLRPSADSRRLLRICRFAQASHRVLSPEHQSVTAHHDH